MKKGRKGKKKKSFPSIKKSKHKILKSRVSSIGSFITQQKTHLKKGINDLRKGSFIHSKSTQSPRERKLELKVNRIKSFINSQKTHLKKGINDLRKVSFSPSKSAKVSKGNKFSSAIKSFFHKKNAIIKEKQQEKLGEEKKKQPDRESANISSNETKIDLLYKMIQEKGQVNEEEASKKLNVKTEIIMVWAKILEEHELINIKYPPFRKPFFKKVEPKKEEQKRE